MKVWGDECLRWWMSDSATMGDECLNSVRVWWMSQVMNVGVIYVGQSLKPWVLWKKLDSNSLPLKSQIRCWIPFQWDVRSCAGSNAGFCKRYRITWCHTARSPICVTTKWPKLYVSKSREIRSRLQYFCFSDVWVCCSNFLFHMSLTLSQSCHSCMLSILMCCNFLQ